MFGVGETVAGFEIDAVVGHGSSADVYRVHRTGESTPLALKVLHADDGDTGRARERFEREFGIASLLDHPHIVAMVSRGEVLVDSSPPRTQLWLAMQYVAGPSAMSLIPREDQQPRVPRYCAWQRRSATPWTTHTPARSCIGTSNPRTSC